MQVGGAAPIGEGDLQQRRGLLRAAWRRGTAGEDGSDREGGARAAGEERPARVGERETTAGT